MTDLLTEQAPPTSVAEYSPTAQALAELQQKYKDVVFDLATKDGDTQAREARRTLVRLRTGLESKRKEIKAPALAHLKQIDAEAARISGEILALEEPIDEQIKTAERKEREAKEARLRAEQERKDRITAAVEQIRRAADMAGKPSTDIAARRDQLEAQSITVEEFGDQAGAAEMARTDAIDRLDTLFDAAEQHEAAQAEIKRQNEELAQLRAADIARQAQEAAQRVEADRVAREQREAEETQRRAALAQQEEELRLQREALAEQQRQADARAAEQRAELDRQRQQLEADQQAERDRVEAARIASEAEQNRIAREAEEERLRLAEADRIKQERLAEEAQGRRLREEAEARERLSKLEKAAPVLLGVLVEWRQAEQSKSKERLAAVRQLRDEKIIDLQ